MTQPLDLRITGGTVLSGCEQPPVKADVGIKEGKITAVGKLEGIPAGEELDATGLFIAPGFIDTHSHSDLTLLEEPLAESALRQGITTQIVGNCGLGVIPARKELHEEIRAMTLETVNEPLVPIQWEGLTGYLEALSSQDVELNVGALVPHCTLRIGVMGYDNQPASQYQLAQMTARLEELLQEGALGLSTGLTYPPAGYADQGELLALAEMVARYDGVMVTHIRYPFISPQGDLLPLDGALEEVFQLPRETGVRLHISHHQTIGSRDWGKMEQTLGAIENEVSQGSDITFDVYPYWASSTTLTILIPDYLLADGPANLYRQLQNSRERQIIEEGILQVQAAMYPTGLEESWNDIIISSADRDLEGFPLAGKSIKAIASHLGLRPEEAVTEILKIQGPELDFSSVYMVRFTMQESEVERAISHPLGMIGTDGRAMERNGRYQGLMVHPRYFGTFPRYLGRYVRDKGLLSWEEAIRKVTSLPAATFRLKERGQVKPGFWGDLVVFDPAIVKDRATFTDPRQYSEGIRSVLVQGQIALADPSGHDPAPFRPGAGQGLCRGS